MSADIDPRERPRSGRGTPAPSLDPGLDEQAELLLRTRRRRAISARTPRPADQRILAHVMDQVLHRLVAVPPAVLDLRADLADRLSLPRHLERRQVPVRIAGHAAGIEVRLAVAGR